MEQQQLKQLKQQKRQQFQADSKVDEYFSLAIGNPFFGLRFVGPFGSSGEAVEYANYYQIPRDEWWVVRLERPGSVKGV